MIFNGIEIKYVLCAGIREVNEKNSKELSVFVAFNKVLEYYRFSGFSKPLKSTIFGSI